MADEIHKIMCMPADAAPGTEGAVKIDAGCGHPVWIAPSSLNLVLNRSLETEIVCLRCVDPKVLREAYEQSRLREVPGQREEVARQIGKEVADDLFDRLGIEPLQ